MDLAIEIIGLHKEVPVGFWGKPRTLLNGVELGVRRGQIFGFLGPNGAGKSTTIKHLIGTLRPTRGQVRLLGGVPTDPATRARLGYLPELPHLPPTLTPRELMGAHAVLLGLPREKRHTEVDDTLARVGLAAEAERRIGTFSKGMQQRVGLGLALLGSPELLILDEPMSGLDPLGRRLVREVIRAEASQGRTVFFSSHVLPDVEALCDEVALLVQGRVRLQGPLRELLPPAADQYEVRFSPGDVPDGRGEAHPSSPRRVRSSHAALPVLPASVAGTLSQHGDELVLRTDAGTDPLAAAQALREAGYRVHAIEPLRPTLEGLLLELLRDIP